MRFKVVASLLALGIGMAGAAHAAEVTLRGVNAFQEEPPSPSPSRTSSARSTRTAKA